MTKLDDGLRNIAMDAHVLHKCFYHFGETVYLSAVPAEGYVFKQWRVEFGNVQLADATSASTTFTMPLSPVELTAVFEVIHLGTPAPSAAIASYNSIAISWQEIPGATGYEVWRALSTSGKCSKVASPVEPHWMDAGLTTGTAYYYKVRAANKAGAMPLYGDYSDPVRVVPVPAAPSSIDASMASYNSIVIRWGAVPGATKYEVYRSTSSGSGYSKLNWNPVPGATGYEIWKRTSSSSTYTLLTTTDSINFVDTGLKKGVTCYYKVMAYRIVGTEKGYSAFSVVAYTKP